MVYVRIFYSTDRWCQTLTWSQYAKFPQDADKTPDLDGVVVDQERITSDDAQTLVHEIGHWMGLRHTFGRVVENKADDCKTDDGLLGTTLTPGWKSVVWDCNQVPCDGRPAEQTNNWMSVRFATVDDISDDKCIP